MQVHYSCSDIVWLVALLLMATCCMASGANMDSGTTEKPIETTPSDVVKVSSPSSTTVEHHHEETITTGEPGNQHVASHHVHHEVSSEHHEESFVNHEHHDSHELPQTGSIEHPMMDDTPSETLNDENQQQSGFTLDPQLEYLASMLEQASRETGLRPEEILLKGIETIQREASEAAEASSIAEPSIQSSEHTETLVATSRPTEANVSTDTEQRPDSENFDVTYVDHSDPSSPKKVHHRRRNRHKNGPNGSMVESYESKSELSNNGNRKSYSKSSASSSSFSSSSSSSSGNNRRRSNRGNANKANYQQASWYDPSQFAMPAMATMPAMPAIPAMPPMAATMMAYGNPNMGVWSYGYPADVMAANSYVNSEGQWIKAEPSMVQQADMRRHGNRRKHRGQS